MERKLVLYDEQSERETVLQRFPVIIVGRGQKEDFISALYQPLTNEGLEKILDKQLRLEYYKKYSGMSGVHLAIVRPDLLDKSLGTTMAIPYHIAQLIDMNSRNGTFVLPSPNSENFVPVPVYDKEGNRDLTKHPAIEVFNNGIIAMPRYIFRLSYRDE